MKAIVSKKTGEFILTGRVNQVDAFLDALVAAADGAKGRAHTQGVLLWTVLDDVVHSDNVGDFTRSKGGEVEVLP